MTEAQTTEAQTTTTETAQDTFSWRSQLPADFQSKFPEYKDGKEGIANLVKSHSELFSMLGDKNNLVKLPNEKSTDDDRKAFNEKINGYLGVPKDVADYKVALPEGAEAIVNEKAMTELKAVALQNGVSAKAFDALASTYLKSQLAEMEAYKAGIKDPAVESENALRIEWKDDYQKNLEGVQAFVDRFLPKEDAELAKGELGNNLQMIKILHNMSKLVGEGKGSPNGGIGDVGLKDRKSVV